jgi:hypothetical protein
MKIPLFLIVLFLAICSPPPKTYTRVEIGMPYMPEFFQMCPGSYNIQTTTTEKSETKVITNKADDYVGEKPRTIECTGTFTFVDNKLVSIVH